MYSLQLSAEQIEIRDTVRDFVKQEVKPVTLKSSRLDACDRSLPMEVLDQASQMGLRTLALSEERGGAGADTLTSCIVAEELATGDADVAATLTETSALAHILFDQRMSPEQCGQFLPQFLADDRYHLALANHEPGMETELGAHYHRPTRSNATVKATAVRAGNRELVLNGVKDCVANAGVAKLFAVEVRLDPDASGAGGGVATVLVPRDTPGLTVRVADDHLHWYHGSSGQIELKDCRVPAENLLAGGTISRDWPQTPAMNLGVGRAAYEAALDYAQLRVQGGRPIVEHQAIGTKLAEIAVKIEVARSAIWRAAWVADHPESITDGSQAALPHDAVARVFTSEMIHQVTKDSAEIFGGMGVMRDMPLQKYIGDALIFLHSGDGNADAKLHIAEALVGYARAPGHA